MTIKEILETYRCIAVVGLSSHIWRPSYSVSRYMQNSGYRIIPVNPRETSVLGEPAYPSLDEVLGPIEIVNIFRRPEYVPDVVESAQFVATDCGARFTGCDHFFFLFFFFAAISSNRRFTSVSSPISWA